MSHHEAHHAAIPTLEKSFQTVGAINALAGNPPNQGWDAVEHQLKIIEGEWTELVEAIAAHDLTKLRDGAGDLLFTLVGLAHRAGIDLKADLHEINVSNLSKFDATFDDAALTRIKYDELGLRTRMFIQADGESQVYVTRVDGDQAIGEKKYPDGKWLKSHQFVDVDFTNNDEHHPLVNAMAPVGSGFLAEEIMPLDKAVAIPHTKEQLTVTAELPSILAVGGIIDSIAENPDFSRAVELWLAQMAYYLCGSTYQPIGTGTTGSTMAVTGAQRFLDTLLHPEFKFRASLTPRYFSDWNTTFEVGIESLFASLDAPDRLTLQRALMIIHDAMVTDRGWQISWHANLTMAWFDSGLPHADSRQLADTIMLQLFGVDTRTIYDSPVVQDELDYAQETPAA